MVTINRIKKELSSGQQQSRMERKEGKERKESKRKRSCLVHHIQRLRWIFINGGGDSLYVLVRG